MDNTFTIILASFIAIPMDDKKHPPITASFQYLSVMPPSGQYIHSKQRDYVTTSQCLDNGKYRSCSLTSAMNENKFFRLQHVHVQT
jgi:hypothetical protein